MAHEDCGICFPSKVSQVQVDADEEHIQNDSDSHQSGARRAWMMAEKGMTDFRARSLQARMDRRRIPATISPITDGWSISCRIAADDPAH